MKPVKILLLASLLLLVMPFFVFAHQSGCHRWHSCPSDTGSYVCGDLGYACQYGTDSYSSGSSDYTSNSYSSFGSSYTSTPDCPLFSTYDSLSENCKCNYGYVVSNGLCTNGNTVCHDKHGYNSSYSGLSKSCECDYGYLFDSADQCVSKNSQCENQLGLWSSYNSLSGNCECRYGYVISGGKCTDGNSVCHAQLGYNSKYDSTSKKCQCENGYTIDDSNQCVQKQNNLYFTLKELDTDNKKAIIKSDYDFRYYLISYNTGCYASSFMRYLNHQIVVNLGTDFDVDTWDKIVLQDDNEVCDITHRERADSSTTLKSQDDANFYYGQVYTQNIPNPTPVVLNDVNPTPTDLPPSPVNKKAAVSPLLIKKTTDSEIPTTSAMQEKTKSDDNSHLNSPPPTQNSTVQNNTPARQGFFPSLFSSIKNFFLKFFK